VRCSVLLSKKASINHYPRNYNIATLVQVTSI
jgi:hypothetical protein